MIVWRDPPAPFVPIMTRSFCRCADFGCKLQEVGLAWIGQTVEVVYDPLAPTEVILEAPGHPPWTASPLVMGEHAGRRPALPDHLLPTAATESRVLRAAEARAGQSGADQAPAISYRQWTENGGDRPV